MKKFYNEYFRITEGEKIREKVMVARVIVMVVIIISCLVATSITAYAYFSYNITSAANNIKAATFKTDISIKKLDANGVIIDDNLPITVENLTKNKVATLEANQKYYITINPDVQSTSSIGFVKITLKDVVQTYHTQQFFKENLLPFSFYITPSADTQITFVDCWGTSIYYNDYINGAANPLYISDINNDLVILVNSSALLQSNPEADINNQKASSSVNSNTSSALTTSQENTSDVSSADTLTSTNSTASTEQITEDLTTSTISGETSDIPNEIEE